MVQAAQDQLLVELVQGIRQRQVVSRTGDWVYRPISFRIDCSPQSLSAQIRLFRVIRVQSPSQSPFGTVALPPSSRVQSKHANSALRIPRSNFQLPMPLSLFLLGPPRVEIDGEVIAFPRQKSLALLVHLAVTGEQQRRDSLAALLWPESADARGSLRRELSSLKSALGNGDWLDAQRENVTLTGDVRLDVDDFLAAVESGDPARWRQAADLYRDNFLTGFSLADSPAFDDWQFFQAEEYRRICAATLEELIAHFQAAGDPDAAIPYARRLLALDNLHELSHRILMCLYALAGQQSAALRQYDECVRLLDEELGVPPEAETTELHEAIRTRRFPAEDDRVTRGQDDKRTVAGQPGIPSSGYLVIPSPLHNLPPQATPFVGRQREVEALRGLLSAPANRLVTITGVGGIGKSRLSLAVAEALRGTFPDGVWFVPLAPLEAAEAVPRAIADALSVPTGDGNSHSLLLHFLRDKQLLLLLDNFEHLLDGADFLAELLQNAPRVKLLVTSQERLNLHEESLYPLGGLEEAARLFIERARRVQPNFDPTAEGEAIGVICRTVEGMPLAIELAASWVRVMACAEIAAEIQHSADFLASNTRNLPARHRSLRALFERSWALLDPDERTLLARLSVFQGGFTRQAAIAVADATPHQLAELVDHSFLRHQADDRFDMHGLLHRFAAEQLAVDSAVERDARQRHAEFYAELVAQAGWELEPADPAASAAADRDGPNILAAWRWGVEQRYPSVVGRMTRWLGDYFRRRGDLLGGRAIFHKAVEAFRSSSADIESAGFLGSLLSQLGQCGDHDNLAENVDQLNEAVRYLRQARSLRPLDLAQALAFLALMQASFGQNGEGAERIEEALGIFREVQNDLGTGAALNSMCVLFWGWGRLREAQKYAEEAARIFEGQEHASYLISRYGIGSILCGRGHFRRAEAILQGLIPQFKALDEQEMAYQSRLTLVDLYTATGNFPAAKEQYSQAYAFADTLGKGYQVTIGMFLSPAALARLSGEPDAEKQLLDGLAVARQIGFEQRISTSLHHLARLRHDQRDYEGALALLDEALTVARKIDFRYATALALTGQGHSQLALKEVDAARTAYAEALEIAEIEGIDRIACDALTGVAQLAHLRGESPLALSLLHFVHTHEASEWETKRRAERLLADLPRTESHTPFPSLAEAIRLARAMLDDKMTGGQDDRQSAKGHPVILSSLHLPTPATSFIGRESELAELSALLSRPDVRLATVVAPGGMGKTRFAIEAARRLAGDFPDGVWFLPLVGVNEASQMLAALVQLLDAPMGAGGAKEALLRYFARCRLLLVLDNFEQLADAAPVLAELLAGGPGVKLLVTSRVRLNLREEWVFPLTGLATADRGRQTADGRGATGSAVRLFVERAGQVQPDFDAEAEAEAVAAICRAVEGMPLGIELAASWLRAMNCAEIAVEIRRDVDFLSTPLRNVPEQHRSMRAVFERSWGLLTADEQRGLARLSVFQGGFTRQAAQAVAEVRLPLLSALVDHSLLRHSASGRYDIHELLRQFAAEQLEERESSDAIHDHHAAYFLELLAAHTDDIQWRRPYETVAELLPDRENFIAGWKRAVQRNLFQSIQQAATTFLVFGNHINAQVVVRNALQAALAQIEKAKDLTANTRNDLIGRILWRVAVLDTLHRDTEIHLAQLSRAKIHLQNVAVDNREEIAVVDIYVAMALGTLGRNNEAVDCLEQSVATFLALENYARLGWAYTMCCYLELGRGRPALAHRWHDLSLAAWRQGGITGSSFLSELLLYSLEGKFEQMRTAGENALQNLPDPFRFENSTGGGRGTILYTIGEWSVFCGAFDEAENYFQQAASILSEEGRAWQLAMGFRTSMATLYRLQHKWELARTHIQSLLKTIRGIGFKQRIAIRLHELAQLEHDLGNYSEAESALAEALEIAHSIDFLFFEAQILCQMGHTAAAERKPQAADFYRQVLEMTAGQSMNPIVLDAVQGAAGLAAAAGDVAQAVEWLALAASHPNGEWETQQKAQKALTEWRGQLSAEEFSAAQARGRGLALETVMLNVRAWCAVDDV